MVDTLKKTKILVYDCNQVFLRYFTKIFPNYIFVNFSGNEGDEFILYEYDLVIFIVDNQINLSEFFKIFNSKIPILFGSSLRKDPAKIKELKSWFDIKFINTSGTKIEVKEQIKFHLDQHTKSRMYTSQNFKN